MTRKMAIKHEKNQKFSFFCSEGTPRHRISQCVKIKRTQVKRSRRYQWRIQTKKKKTIATTKKIEKTISLS